MSLLKAIDNNPTGEPVHAKAPPDRLISGNPALKTWLQDASRDGTVRTGVWEATVGETRSIKGETFEFCHILQGVVEIVEESEGGATHRFGPGDSFVMKPGFKGVWRTIETVRKIFVVVS